MNTFWDRFYVVKNCSPPDDLATFVMYNVVGNEEQIVNAASGRDKQIVKKLLVDTGFHTCGQLVKFMSLL